MLAPFRFHHLYSRGLTVLVHVRLVDRFRFPGEDHSEVDFEESDYWVPGAAATHSFLISYNLRLWYEVAAEEGWLNHKLVAGKTEAVKDKIAEAQERCFGEGLDKKDRKVGTPIVGTAALRECIVAEERKGCLEEGD